MRLPTLTHGVAATALALAGFAPASVAADEPATPILRPLPQTQTNPAPVRQTQPLRQLRRVRQIHPPRPEPIRATPLHIAIAKPVLTLDNKPTVDLRNEAKTLGVYATRNQGNRGTCSVFALSFLLDFMYAKHFGKQNANFSEEFLNYASNHAIGQYADGGFFDDLDLGYQTYGDVGEASAPYSATFNPNLSYAPGVLTQGQQLAPRLKPHFIKQWDVTTGLLPSQLLAIMFQLKQGRPVAAGLRWPKDGKFQTQTILGITMMTAPPLADVFDGHSIVFVGFKVSDKFPGGGYLIFRNSWGPTFMEDGYGYMSFDYANKYTNDVVEYVLN